MVDWWGKVKGIYRRWKFVLDLVINGKGTYTNLNRSIFAKRFKMFNI
jgi:hypothetical protein